MKQKKMNTSSFSGLVSWSWLGYPGGLMLTVRGH